MGNEDYAPGPREHKRLERRFFILLLAMVSFLFLFMLNPFWSAIFWACIIALIFQPLYHRLLNSWGSAEIWPPSRPCRSVW